jgi:acylphosphatase
MDRQRIRVRAIVGGRVQGVWFRQSTAAEARLIGVDGWVRNLPDGRVEAVFEGSPDAVTAALDYVGRGPEAAVVDEVQTFAEEPTGERGFSAR